MQCLDYERITHLWFSHEHPDHFSPGAVKAIPEHCRANIAVLFQETEDKRVVNFCKKLGFRSVTEMRADEWVTLTPTTRALCNPQIDEWQGDSWLCLKSGDECLLNVNDCGIYTAAAARKIAEKTGPVDVLCTQFSYAAWQGNADDLDGHKYQAARQLEHIQTQAEAIKPRYILPFASFVWFCHAENYFLNAGMNSIEDAAAYIEQHTKARPLVMYPGDSWTIGAEHDWHVAARRYLDDAATVHAAPALIKSHPLDEQRLTDDARQFIERCMQSSSPLLVRLYLVMESYRNRRATGIRSALRDLMDLLLLRIEPASIFITDQSQAYKFNLPGGLQRFAGSESDCDISMSAESLDHCFLIDWGGETLLINGRFQEPQHPDKPKLSRGDQARRWFKFTDLTRRLNMGFQLNWSVAREAIAWRLKTLLGLKQTVGSG
jgi:hypothetical protein